MNTKVIAKSVRRLFGKTKLTFKRHSPEILIITGLVGAAATTVMACKETAEATDCLDETRAKVEKVHQALQMSGYTYTKQDSAKDLAIIYARTGFKLARIYGPAMLMGAASTTCILGSHHIMKGRNVALAAAYAGVSKQFKEYSDRVADRFGTQVEKELRYNLSSVKATEVTVDEDGNETKTEKEIEVSNELAGYSPYAKFFDDTCMGWSRDPDMNLMFLHRQQDYANEKLQEQGYLFLNDVYGMLGLQKTQAGQIVGWTYDKNKPAGDNYIDFGIYDLYHVSDSQAERKRAFVNGYEKSIILDFNVDGNILSIL